jgi:predicted XRE-type DNA-binding protein
MGHHGPDDVAVTENPEEQLLKHESSPNIFADLGLPDADNHFLKAQIVAELYRLTTERKLTQAKAGELMGISQPEVSRLFKGNFREYSIDRLMTFLTGFDRDVEIVSRPRAVNSDRGHISFRPAMA